MDGRTNWRLVLALLCAGAIAGAIGVVSHATGALRRLERPSVDTRFSLRSDQPPARRVLVVALDTTSYRHLPEPPIPRAIDARLVERLTAAGARVIAFDFALERPSVDARGDRAIIAALAQARHAVVSVTAIEQGGGTAPLAGRVPLASVGVQPGVTLLPLDGDGAIRRFPSGLGGVESFALASARSEDPAVPTHPPANSLIDYPGPPGTVRALSFLDVLSGRFNPSAVKGKVVVVGPTAPIFQDIHRSPVGAAMSGPEIQADAIVTALAGFPLRGASSVLITVTLLGLGLLVPILWLSIRWASPSRTDENPDVFAGVDPNTVMIVAIGLLTAVGWSVGTQVAFDNGTVLDYTDGLLSIACATGLVWALLSIVARRERLRVRRLFAAASPEIVDRVLRGSSTTSASGGADDIIAGYRVQSEVGHGGMGVVYRAQQLSLDRPVALKLILQDLADLPAYRARFKVESRRAASVNHPHVIPVLDAGEDGELLYMAMQFVDGIDLSERIRGLGALESYEAAHLIDHIAGALDAVHQRGLVHCDVKPANILISAQHAGVAFLTDFGVAKQLTATTQLDGSGRWVGTPDYLAPEQIQQTTVDHRVDVYALAAVLYHCLTGTVPFPGADLDAVVSAHINDPRPSALALRPELPTAIDRVIARGMAVNPQERYQSAGDFAADTWVALGLPRRQAMNVEKPQRLSLPDIDEHATTRAPSA
jgi:CHASE2 domain-containing sensor protein/tRNA A-37 threonylcarbamoyl transferase component Bud32